jgi:hypothetical protein
MQGLLILVVIAGVAPAVLHEVRVAALPAGSTVTLTTAGGSLNAVQRDAVSAVDKGSIRLAVMSSVRDEAAIASGAMLGSSSGTGSRAVVFARCEDVRRFLRVTLPECLNGTAYRIVERPEELGDVARPALYFRDSTFTTVVPQAAMLIPNAENRGLPHEAILLTSRSPGAARWSRDTLFVQVVPDIAAADGVRNAIKRVAPAADITVNGVNPAQVRAYQIHNGVVTLGLVISGLLALGAFTLAGVDRAMERRGNVAAMSLLGVSRRTLRRSQRTQLVLPLLIGLVPAAIAGNLLGWTYLALGGQKQGVFLGGVSATLILFVVTVGSAALVGGVVRTSLTPTARERN